MLSSKRIPLIPTLAVLSIALGPLGCSGDSSSEAQEPETAAQGMASYVRAFLDGITGTFPLDPSGSEDRCPAEVSITLSEQYEGVIARSTEATETWDRLSMTHVNQDARVYNDDFGSSTETRVVLREQDGGELALIEESRRCGGMFIFKQCDEWSASVIVADRGDRIEIAKVGIAYSQSTFPMGSCFYTK